VKGGTVPELMKTVPGGLVEINVIASCGRLVPLGLA